jgi:ADP-heptose:LPS heptosyltransferase
VVLHKRQPAAGHRTLVLRRGAIGDSICFLPVIDAARTSWPHHELHFAGEAAVADLFEIRGIVDRGFSSEDLQLWRGPAALARYDVVIGDVEGSTVRFDVVVDERDETPASRQLCERAARVWPMPWPSVPKTPRLPRAATAASPLLWLHPGSGSPRKNWPGFAELAEHALGAGIQVAASFGAADEAIAEQLERRLPAAVRRRTGLVLTTLASELERAAVYVGNDSGISHLAAALGVTTVALFGPSSCVAWRPHGARILDFDASPQEVGAIALQST